MVWCRQPRLTGPTTMTALARRGGPSCFPLSPLRMPRPISLTTTPARYAAILSWMNLGRSGHASCQDCISYLVKRAVQGCIHLNCLLYGHTLAVTLVTKRHGFATTLYLQSAGQWIFCFTSPGTLSWTSMLTFALCCRCQVVWTTCV